MQWAERLMEGGGNEQWGENWVEDFKDGAGSKKVSGTSWERLTTGQAPHLQGTAIPLCHVQLDHHTACCRW